MTNWPVSTAMVRSMPSVTPIPPPALSKNRSMYQSSSKRLSKTKEESFSMAGVIRCSENCRLSRKCWTVLTMSNCSKDSKVGYPGDPGRSGSPKMLFFNQ
jgi:hypothetical protein